MARKGYGALRKENAELRNASSKAWVLLMKLKSVMLGDTGVNAITLSDVDEAIGAINGAIGNVEKI
jgi:hypothetical protein